MTVSVLRRSPESYTAGWCWQVCLRTLDVDVPTGPFAFGTHPCRAEIDSFIRPTYAIDNVFTPGDGPAPSLGRFITEHPTGLYLIYTADHVMVLHDGILTDTDSKGPRRRVQLANQLTPRSQL